MKRKYGVHGTVTDRADKTAVRLKTVVRSRTGNGYIFTCVLILAIAMVLTVTLKYTSVIRLADKSRTVVREHVESYLTQYSIDNYRKLRTGSRLENADVNAVKSGVTGSLGVDGAETELVIGAYSYRLKNIVVAVAQADHVSVTVSYTIGIPVRLLGESRITCSIPLEVTCRLVSKN